MAAAILCGPFWFSTVFLILSVKGVKLDEMGHIGTIAGGIEFAVKKTGIFVKGIGQLVFTILDKLRSLVGELIGERFESDIEVGSNSRSGANFPPPPYYGKQFLIGF